MAAQGVERSHRVTDVNDPRRTRSHATEARDRSTRGRLGPGAPSGRWRSAPPSPPLARQPPAQRRGAGGVSGSHRQGRVPCVPIRGARRRAPRQPRIAPVATRHARGPSAPSTAVGRRACGADHAAALWQLCCRIGRTTTVAFQMVGSHARGHNLPRATGARRGVNNGAAKRAGDGDRAYPANRHRVCIRTRSCVRRLPILIPIGAAFGYGTRTHTLSRILLGCGAAQSTVRRQSAHAREHRLGTPGRETTGTGTPKSVGSQFGASD